MNILPLVRDEELGFIEAKGLINFDGNWIVLIEKNLK
jgi:hypothetical protein